MKGKCTLLVNSCDAYADVWDLFFSALSTQWPDCDMRIILNTEHKHYSNPGVEVHHYKNKRGESWGRRFKEVLKQIHTPYVFPVLEDFVLAEPFTGQEILNKAINWMDANPEIGVFYLHKHPNVIQKPTEYPGFGLMPQECDYKLTTHIGVWRKEYLDKCIKGFETPWEWELYCTKRAWKFKEKEYALLNNQNEVYVFPWGGVIWRGLWHPEVTRLAQQYGVNIEFNKRGFMDENNPYRVEPFYSIREHIPKYIFTIEFWKQFSKKFKLKYRKMRCEH